MKAIDAILGKDLTGFSIQQLTEVYQTDVEGRGKVSSLGFFKNPKIAKAYAGIQIDAPWFHTNTAYVLTDGKIGFMLNTKETVTLLDDEEAKLKIVESARKKLSPEERDALGL